MPSNCIVSRNAAATSTPLVSHLHISTFLTGSRLPFRAFLGSARFKKCQIWRMFPELTGEPWKCWKTDNACAWEKERRGGKTAKLGKNSTGNWANFGRSPHLHLETLTLSALRRAKGHLKASWFLASQGHRGVGCSPGRNRHAYGHLSGQISWTFLLHFPKWKSAVDSTEVQHFFLFLADISVKWLPWSQLLG